MARIAKLRDAGSWAPVYGASRHAGLERFDVVVVDASVDRDGSRSFRPEDVQALRSSGRLVVAYLSAGTVAMWRAHTREVPEAWLLAEVEHWPGERYVDAREEGWQAILEAEGTRLARDGLDGLYLDNLDAAEDFPGIAEGIVAAVKRLRSALPEHLLIAQNGLGIANSIPIDALAHEDVWWVGAGGYRPTPRGTQRRLLRELRALRDAGLPILTLDYTPPGSPAAAEIVAASLAEGFLPAVTEVEVEGLPHAHP